ncbi:MAG: VCBS repeat-containing protein, partial [Planctomycetes bacterium]|nr:VCBS repeat-containing protein [Planctomycetota bacterium]
MEVVPSDGDTIQGLPEMQIVFSEAMEPNSVTSVNHYRLEDPQGLNAQINSAVYDPATFTCTLHVNNGNMLAEGNYKLFVLAERIFDASGNPLMGDPDFAVSVLTESFQKIEIRRGNGDGTFYSQMGVEAPSDPGSIAWGDLDGDNIGDLVAILEASDQVLLYRGLGEGQFETPVAQAVGSGALSVKLGDLNNDGKDDIVTANLFGTVTVLLSQGAGLYQRTDYNTPDRAKDVVLGDFNLQNGLDLAVSVENQGLAVFFNGGTGAFGAPQIVPANADSGLATGDVDDDGYLDVVALGSAARTVSVLYGGPAGAFTAAIWSVAPHSPLAVAIADVVVDGHKDVIYIEPSSRTLNVLKGGVNRMFDPLPPISTFQRPTDIDAADFNRDGYEDVIISTTNDQQRDVVSLFFGSPMGLSSLMGIGAGPSSTNGLVVGELNGVTLVSAFTVDRSSRIIDDFDPPSPIGSVSFIGDWATGGGVIPGIGPIGRNGNVHLAHGESFLTSVDVATWTFNVPEPGRYRVSATWFTDPSSQFLYLWSDGAAYEVSDGATSLGAALINQQLLPDDFADAGSSWEDLGVFDITDTTLTVRLFTGFNNKNVYADAIRIEKVADLSPAAEVHVTMGGIYGVNIPDGGTGPIHYDNFNDNSFDLTRWIPMLGTGPGSGGNLVVEQTGRLEISAGGGLNGIAEVKSTATNLDGAAFNLRPLTGGSEGETLADFFGAIESPDLEVRIAIHIQANQSFILVNGAVVMGSIPGNDHYWSIAQSGPDLHVSMDGGLIHVIPSASFNGTGQLVFRCRPPSSETRTIAVDDVVVLPANANFGTTDFYESVQKTFTISNQGTVPLNLGSLTITGGAFTVVPPLPAPVLAPGTSTTFTIRMSGETPGVHTATVSFGNSDPDESLYNFTVTGMVRTTNIVDDGDPGFSMSPLPVEPGGWGQMG